MSVPRGGYVLEVFERLPSLEDKMLHNGDGRHIGYMDIVFKTKNEAAEYYAMYNPHMRRLNALTWCSDWDPITRLFYVVREYYGFCKTIQPFNPMDNPTKLESGRSYPSSRQRKMNWTNWKISQDKN